MNGKAMRGTLSAVGGVIIGLGLGLLVVWAAGENPIHVMRILARGAFGTRYDLGMTLFYSTPLIFTGLSVAVVFRGGMFNIGAEGQLTMGTLAAAAAGILMPFLPPVVAPIAAWLCATLVGGAWGAIPGWLRARRGSHEVINTIMLNFIAAGLCSYLALYPFRNPLSQNPETREVAGQFKLAPFPFFEGAPVGWALPIALLMALLVWVLLWRTVMGFEWRSVGLNETAARTAGIDVARARIGVFALAGALAGMVGVAEVLGNSGRFRVGFSPEYGFMGIAVALLGRNHPVGVIAAALLLGALHKGAAELDLETERVTRDVSLVFQGLIILCVSAEGWWFQISRRNRTIGPPSPTR
jgi:simple sugar transport system permease protein